MAHYDLYESLDLDRSSSSSDLVAALDERLAQPTHTNPGGEEELRVAKAIVGDPHKRSMYDARLQDPTAQEITIGSLRSLAWGQTGAPHSAPQQYGPQQQAPQYYGGPQQQAGPQQAPLLPQFLQFDKNAPLLDKTTRIGGVILLLGALLLLISFFLRWGTLELDNDAIWLTAFSADTDHPNGLPADFPTMAPYVVGLWVLISFALTLATGVLMLLNKFRTVALGLLVATVISLGLTRIPIAVMDNFLSSRGVRAIASSDNTRLQSSLGAGYTLAVIVLALATIVLLVQLALFVRKELIAAREQI